MLRCSRVTTDSGQRDDAQPFVTAMPMMVTPVSSTSEISPVARVASHM